MSIEAQKAKTPFTKMSFVKQDVRPESKIIVKKDNEIVYEGSAFLHKGDNHCKAVVRKILLKRFIENFKFDYTTRSQIWSDYFRQTSDLKKKV